MLRSGPALGRQVVRPVGCRPGRRVTNLAVVTIVRMGFRYKHFRYAARADSQSVGRQNVTRFKGLARESITRKRVLVDTETLNGDVFVANVVGQPPATWHSYARVRQRPKLLQSRVIDPAGRRTGRRPVIRLRAASASRRA